MRVVIFIIFCLFFLVWLFGLYLDIGMRGDAPLWSTLIEGLLSTIFIPLPLVIFAFNLMRQKDSQVSIKKWQKIILIIFLFLLFIYCSLINLGNTLPAKLYLLGIIIELAIFIIFLPPLYYLIKILKR